MDEIKNEAGLLEELEALKAENERLKTKNAKLYRDCVSFAKKIKANEKKDTRILALEREIEELRAALEEKENVSSYNQPEFYEEEPEIISAASVKRPIVYSPVQPEPEGQTLPKNHNVSTKPSGLRIFVRTFLWILFIISFLVCIGSGITYLFSTTYADYTFAGYRFATVKNNAMSPKVSSDDVVLVKYTGFDGMELDSLVVTRKDGRSVGTLIGVSVSDGENTASIKDKNSTYTVTDDQFVGKVKFTIPKLGKLVSYASQNHYNYLAIVASTTLILLALLILIPANKTKNPKFGKDYTVEDFTI